MGRWLWDEETRLRKRLRKRYWMLNVHELQVAAVASVGTDKRVDMVKLAEGGFNKAL